MFVYVLGLCTGRWNLGLRGRIVRLRFRNSARVLAFRLGTSDARVIGQAFLKGEYAWLEEHTELAPQTVLDCGANIGAVSVLFAEAFPGAQIVAVEPDAGNFAVLSLNASQYGGRIRPVQTGVWKRDAPLRVVRGDWGDGREWSFQVEECGASEADLTGMTIPTIMRQMGLERINYLKIDIEDAEKEVFDAGAAAWLSHVDNLSIELHSPASHAAAAHALESFAAVSTFRAGELLVVLGLHPEAEAQT